MTSTLPLSSVAIDQETIAALRILAQLVAEEGRRIVLIGATVPQLFVDLRRPTHDVIGVITADSWADFDRIRGRLFKAGFRPGSAPHELRFGEAVRIDLIPYGAGVVQDDRLEWPGADRIMSTLGVEEAFECAMDQKVAAGLSLPVVKIPGFVLLKIVAYLDRPQERAKDLADVAHCFEYYEESLEGSQRFDVAGVTVEGQPVQFEEAGAFLLGAELATLARPKSLVAVRGFLERVPDEYAMPIHQILAEERRVGDNEGRGRRVLRLFRVFAAGLNNDARAQ